VLVCNLTSSYVEGIADKDPTVQRGYSCDHRPDCKPVVIVLMVKEEGFPLSYETFHGSQAGSHSAHSAGGDLYLVPLDGAPS
jgi:transposase